MQNMLRNGLPGYEYQAENPVFFIKPSTSVIGTGQNIIYPKIGQHVDHEAELALVISKVSKNISRENWTEHVLGLTAANDLSERVHKAKQVTLQEQRVLTHFVP